MIIEMKHSHIVEVVVVVLVRDVIIHVLVSEVLEITLSFLLIHRLPRGQPILKLLHPNQLPRNEDEPPSTLKTTVDATSKQAPDTSLNHHQFLLE